MKKLYYDDALKSAWMAREHDVVFTKETLVNDNSAKFWTIDSRYTFHSEEVRLGMTIPPNTKFYIHKDSYHIFEPVEGDVMLSPEQKKGSYWQRKSSYIWDRAYTRKGRKLDTIIQRNNTAFFKPEEKTDEQ